MPVSALIIIEISYNKLPYRLRGVCSDCVEETVIFRRGSELLDIVVFRTKVVHQHTLNRSAVSSGRYREPFELRGMQCRGPQPQRGVPFDFRGEFVK